jgi:hypothetical protein
MWYRIKSVLAHHANILGPGDVNTFYSTLLEMIDAQGLFRYRDIGFMARRLYWLRKRSGTFCLSGGCE